MLEKWDNYRCIFQFIENKRGAGGQRETFLMQQPSHGSPHVSHSLARVPDRHVSSGGWASSVSRNLSLAPSRGEALSEFCSSDLQLLIPDRGENGGEIEKPGKGKVCEWLHPWSGYIEKVLLILQRDATPISEHSILTFQKFDFQNIFKGLSKVDCALTKIPF